MASSEFYINEQIAEREDGLCPTKLPDDYTATITAAPDAFVVSFQTNSRLLNKYVGDRNDASAELEFICESISRFVMENVDEEEHTSALIALDFEIEGCIWKMDLNPEVATSGLQIHVKLLAKADAELGTIWVTRTYMVDTKTGGSKPLTKSELKQLGTARIAVEQTALVIRKAVLRCEFPEFPEGGKEKAFKQVYKLNIKVRQGILQCSFCT